MFELVPFSRRGSFSPFAQVEDMFRELSERSGSALAGFTSAGGFKVDVKESEIEYTISAEIPGIAKENITLDLSDDGYLTLAVKKEENTEDSGKVYVHRETRASSAQRMLYLADSDPESVKAKLDAGILTIDIAKLDKTPKKTNIAID
ncbi:MAG: Hsp20 family protein [Oscillospiraceae bacterium]|jgi:HSP20 family protein|nr:Hsp20 family protein [Oscillospiraceae bacterium]